MAIAHSSETTIPICQRKRRQMPEGCTSNVLDSKWMAKKFPFSSEAAIREMDAFLGAHFAT